jgi:hypothetical protein
MKLKCIFSSMDIVNVQIAKSILESDGIESFIPNEQINNILPYASLAFSAIELMVKEEDFEDAEISLADFKNNILENKTSIVEDEQLLTENKEEFIVCPKCHSDKIEIKVKSFNILIIIIFLIFQIPVAAKKAVHVCKECGYKWKKNK